MYGCNQDSPNIQQIENMQFFIDNKKNDQIVEVEPGLQYMIINEGDAIGQSPELNQTISAHFHGTLTSGDVFWTSISISLLSSIYSIIINNYYHSLLISLDVNSY